MALPRHLLVILGAGASTPFDLPLLRQIFSNLRVQAYLRENHEAHAFFDEFWSPFGITLDTAAKGITLEEMMDDLLNKKGGAHKGRHSQDYRKERFFIDTVAYKALGYQTSSRKKAFNPFISWSENFADSVTVATFNWDLMYEACYYHTRKANPNLVLSLKDWDPSDSKTTLLKLHGSLSWWLDNDELSYKRYGSYKPSQPSPLEEAWAAYSPTTPFMPVIVEPSSSKSDANEMKFLDAQWDSFEGALDRCTHILSIGYSWPQSDKLVRERCAGALQKRIDELSIVDINPTPTMAMAFPRIADRIHPRISYTSDFLTDVANAAFDFGT